MERDSPSRSNVIEPQAFKKLTDSGKPFLAPTMN